MDIEVDVMGLLRWEWKWGKSGEEGRAGYIHHKPVDFSFVI